MDILCLFIHSSSGRHFGYFPRLAVMNNATVDVCVHVSVWTHVFISLGRIPRTRITQSYGNSVFNSLRDHRNILHKNCKRIVTLDMLNLLICVHDMFLHIYSLKNFKMGLLRLISIESVMPSNHLILCHPLFSCPQSFPA